MPILLEEDYHVSVVIDEAILLLRVGVVPDGAVQEILVESFEERQRIGSLEVVCGHVADRDEQGRNPSGGGWAEEQQDIPGGLNDVVAGE